MPSNYPNGFPNGLQIRGIEYNTVGGTNYFMDVTSGSDNNNGKRWQKAFKTMTKAFTVMKKWDNLFVMPGSFSGNHTTPLNADAPFCSVIGVNATYMGVGPWAAPTSTGSPIIDVRARGWRFAGLEFEGMTGAAAIRVNSEVTRAQRGADFFQVDSCLFSGGKTGIEFNGGGTYWVIRDNHFSLLTTSGGAGIYVSSSSFQIPALGLVRGNRFDNNINHIYGGVTRGWSDTVFEDNNFQQDGNGQNASILLDIRGGGGGNSVINNYFDVTQAQYTDDAGTAFIRTNSTDYGAGNSCNDGVAEDVISV